MRRYKIRTYLYSSNALHAQLTNKEGSRASRLIQEREAKDVTGTFSAITILKVE